MPANKSTLPVKMIPDKENRVSIVEVGPRDGLQNEPAVISLQTKLELIQGLLAAGLKRIEAGAFVNPERVPQMADSGQVFDRLKKRQGVVYSALTPNLKGLDHALKHGAQEVAVFAAASEEFSQRNLNASISESMDRFAEVTRAATQSNIPVRAYISCALGCPFSGQIDAKAVVELASQFVDQGCYEICLADTIGVGTQKTTEVLLRAYEKVLPLKTVGIHLHDTYGQALTNAKLALDMGIRTFDASVAGLGGCPFAPGATGNLATEDLIYMLHGAGYETGIDLTSLASVGQGISQYLGRANTSRAGSALLAKISSDTKA